MKKALFILLVSCLTLSFYPNLGAQNQDQATDILAKNIQAAGGLAKIQSIKNYAFTAQNQRFYISLDGRMKITSGREPAVSEVILVDQKKVIRNCFQTVTEYSGFLQSSYQVMAKLRSGLFTLKNFKDSLEYQGLKKFGAKQHHVFKANQGPLEVGFFLDPETFQLKRLVLKGYDQEKGHYEVNHDFGPYQQYDSVFLPSSWFVSQVGTRGQYFEISDIKFNLELPPEFFSSVELNIGQVDIKPGLIKGNIVDFRLARNNRLTIDTNITWQCFEQANISPGSKVLFKLADTELELKVYAERPPREELGPGAIFMMPDIEDKHMIVYILSSDYAHLGETLEPLLPLEVKIKNENLN